MPDVRGDSDGTLYSQTHFMRIFHQAYNMRPSSATPNVMSVIQGRTVREAEEHVLKVADSWAAEMVRGRYGKVVFGIPRRMSEDTGERSGRIDLVEFIASHFGPMFPIHLLGLSRANPREVQFIAKEFKEFVRGIDTDAPFVWTAENKHLDANDTAERPDGYLNMGAGSFPGPLVRHNIDTLEKWCRGE
jgi:hypothetical protein